LESIDGTGEILKIATYDIINDIKTIMDDVFDSNYGVNVNVPVQSGTDSGIQRSIKIDHNYFNNSRLTLNREYYFLVTAYGYNEFGSPKTLESSTHNIIIVRPQIPNQWEENEDVVYGSTYQTEHSAGNGDGFVNVRVVDPTKITGNDYKITFNEQLTRGDSSISITNWNLINITTNEELLSNQLIINGINQLTGDEESGEANAIVDGLQFIVNGPVPSFRSVGVYANASGVLNPPVSGMYWNYYDWDISMQDYSFQQTNGEVWFLDVHPGYGNPGPDTWEAAALAGSGYDVLIPYDYEIRFTEEGGLAFDNWSGLGNVHVPFEWWNIGINTPDDPSDDVRLIPWWLDDDGSGDWNVYAIDTPGSSADNDPFTDRVYVHMPIDDTPGQQGYDNFFANVTPDGAGINAWSGGPAGQVPPLGSYSLFSRTIMWSWNGGDVTDPTFPANMVATEPETGTVFRIVTTKPNALTDEFMIATAGVTGSAKTFDPDGIKVWPNPYFGFNPEERDPVDQQIHFTNLPSEGECTIRIFDLAGVPVRTITHDNGTTLEVWNVKNDSNIPVASGMYVVVIETDEGQKILKIAIIQPEQRLDLYG